MLPGVSSSVQRASLVAAIGSELAAIIPLGLAPIQAVILCRPVFLFPDVDV